MNDRAESIVAYVDALELPRARVSRGPAYESVDAEALGPKYLDAQQTVAVGAQLAEFTAKVPAELRAAISDSLLLAQLAANKAAEKAGASANVFAWYDKYIEVLKGIGWQVIEFEQQAQQVSNASGGVHSAIIPVITAMLGPAAAVGSMVLSVLSGLQEMDRSSKWITLFDRASQHANGAKFQISHVDLPEGADPVIKVACFSIDAKKQVTQVLFFKFSEDSAELRKAVGSFTAGRSRLLASHTAIGERVEPFIAEYVSALEI
jgi:hypothetical protein